MGSTAAELKAILKKDDLESNTLGCDSWLLPEIQSHHTVQGKETRQIRKNSNKAIDAAPANLDKNNSESSDSSADLQQPDDLLNKPTDNNDTSSDSDLETSISISDNLVPQKLSEFNEQLTLKKLRQKVNEIQREAWKIGHNDGMQAGFDESKLDLEQLQKNLGGQIEQLASQLDCLLTEQHQSLQSALHAIVVQIVEKLTAISFNLDPEALNSILNEALESYPKNAEKPKVRLCQGDMKILEENNLLVESCLWEVDEAVTPGGFFVAGKYAEIDHSFETRLQQIINQYFES